MTETKKHIRQEFDKFTQQTVTQTLKGFVGGDGTISFGNVEGLCKIDAGLRHVKSPDVEFLVLDLYLDSKEWFFLRNGRLSLVIDSENLSLQCFESYTNTNSLVYQGVTEVVYYNLSKGLLKKICDSRDLSIRVSGNKYINIDDKDTANFKIMCQQFYNNFYDQTLYSESLLKVIRPIELNKGGCFIATAAMGDYNHPLVIDLRLFRDNWLLKRDWGTNFTTWYYKHGPKAAYVIERSLLLRKITFYLIVIPLQYITKNLR